MIFTSGAFLVFFLVVYAVYWILRGRRTRIYWLLLGSQFFYAWWDWRFLGLMWFAILTCHFGAIMVARGRAPRLAMATSIVALLGVLAYFKYFNFFVGSAVQLLESLGLGASPFVLQIILPVGISFFTFEAIAYVVDVWRKEVKPQDNIAHTAMYISFFPHLLAGPIIRPHDFMPQLEQEKRFNGADLLIGMRLFLIGFIYKAVFSDNISPFVDEVYADVHLFDNTSLAMATLGFYAQIYFDFAGYSTMAIGVARMFGYWFPRNFNYPYRSVNVTEFWRRWHISLSSWLRDYLYIPLGGNRGGESKRRRNLMLTMLLGGLWHGASWNFVLWGGLHGLALNVHKSFTRWAGRVGGIAIPAVVGTAAAWLLTQVFVYATWIPFRAEGFRDTWDVFRAISGLRDDAGLRTASIPYLLIFAPLVVDTFVVSFLDTGPRAAARSQGQLRLALAFGIAFAFLLFMMPLEVTSFIYFQF